MKRYGQGELVPTDAGFSWRVRLGTVGRKTFPLCAGMTAEQAEERRAVLADIKRDLKRSGAPLERVERFLAQAADADAPMLRLVLQVVAEQCAGKLVGRAARSGAPTFREVAELWTSGELAQRYPDQIKTKRSADADVSRLSAHVYPHPLASKPIDRVTLNDCEAVMSALSRELSPATRRHVLPR